MHARWKALGSSLKTALWWTPVALTINDCVIGGATINGYSMQPTLNIGERSCAALGCLVVSVAGKDFLKR